MIKDITIKKAGLILFVLCLLTYSRGLHNDFSTDSYYYLHQEYKPALESNINIFKEDPRKHQHYNPLDFAFNAVLFKVLRGSLQGIRLVNLLIFFGVCVFFFAFAAEITRNKSTALLASALYCLHPFNADILNHITLNATLWCSLLTLLSLLTLTKSLNNTEKRFYLPLSLLCAATALLFFEAAILLPFYVVILLTTVKSIRIKETMSRSLPFLLIAMCYFIIWLFMAGSRAGLLTKMNDLNISLFSFSASFFYLLKWYIVNAFVPHSVVFMYNIPPVTQNLFLVNILGTASLAAAGYLLLFKWKKDPKAFALLWFLIGFLIAIPGMLTHANMGVIIEPYWFSFSSMGFFLLIAILLIDFKDRIRVNLYKIFLTTIFVFLFVTTQHQISVGKTERSYGKYWLTIAPNNYLALTSLARNYAYSKDFKKALDYYQRVLDSNLYVSDKVYFNMGEVYREMNDLTKAKQFFNQAITAAPSSPYAYYSLGKISIKEKNFQNAIRLLEKALKVEHRSPLKKQIQVKLSVLYYGQGSLPKSTQLIEQIIEDNPTPYTFLLLSNEFYTFRLDNVARGLLDEAIQLYPDFKEFYLLYGTILANQNDLKQAILAWEQGSKIDPADRRFADNISKANKLMNR